MACLNVDEENRIIYLADMISEEVYADMALYINSWDIENPEEPITIYITTDGGCLYSTMAIFDLIKNTSAPTYGVAIGKVFSGGLSILQACDERIATENTRFMIHSVVSGTDGHISHMHTELQEGINAQKKYSKTLRCRSNVTQKMLNDIKNKNTYFYFDAEKALELGLVDEIIK